MGLIRVLSPAKLIIVMLKSKNLILGDEEKSLLKRYFGEMDFVSEELPFDIFTYYYNEEMGSKINATIISFEELIHPSELSYIKNLTNSLELYFAIDGKRTINFDPGYFYGAQFILATTKPREFRSYLGNGIWSEPVYYYSKKKLHPFSTTYPNYKNEKYISIFEYIRTIYLNSIKKFRGD